MAKYVALITGRGDGCDYSIDCNVTFRKFEANSIDEAVEYVLENVVEYYGYDRFEDYEILEISGDITKDVDERINFIKDEQEKEEQKKEQEKLERSELEQLARLQAKYNK